jgi:hypothetical protein
MFIISFIHIKSQYARNITADINIYHFIRSSKVSRQLTLLPIPFASLLRRFINAFTLTGPDIIRAQNAPIVDASKNNDSNKNNACAQVCNNPAKRRRVSFLHIGSLVYV